MIPLDIPVSSPSVRLPYKRDDVTSSFFLSTTSTVPNASILFAILYARAFLSAEVVNDSPGYPGFIALCQTALQT